jgi:DNA-directed RNA polymerase specialized sigma24 family protein
MKKKMLAGGEMPPRYVKALESIAPALQSYGLDGDEELAEFAHYFIKGQLHLKHEQGKASTWVLACAKRWAKSQKRKRAREGRADYLAKRVVADRGVAAYDPTKTVIDRDSVEVLMSKLTPTQQQVVTEVARGNCHATRAAECMGMTPGAVWVTLNKVRRKAAPLKASVLDSR